MHTNNTSHYNLPQFIGSDIPNPLTDWNDSMQDIDTAMYEIKTQADEIGSNVVQDETDISDLQSQANLTDDNITLLNQQTTAARTAATDAQDAANRNASNIATLQQSVANNRTSITQYNNRFNQNVPFAFGIEEVEDPENPGTMIEKYGYYTNDDPTVFVPFGESIIKAPNAVLNNTNGADINATDGVVGSIIVMFSSIEGQGVTVSGEFDNLEGIDILYAPSSPIQGATTTANYRFWYFAVGKITNSTFKVHFSNNSSGGEVPYASKGMVVLYDKIPA